MYLNFCYYHLKTDCYVSSKPHGNHKAETYIQTIGRTLKHDTTVSHQITENHSLVRRMAERNYKTENNLLTGSIKLAYLSKITLSGLNPPITI